MSYIITMRLKLNQSYRALQIYVRQNGMTPVSFKHSCAQQKALKLAHARDHSYHVNQVLNQNGRDNSMTSIEDGQTDGQMAFQLDNSKCTCPIVQESV